MAREGSYDSRNSKPVSGKKRRYKDWSDRGSTPPKILNNPKRGAPGFVITCERGREQKCQREAVEIIEHYFSKHHGVMDKDEKEATTTSATSTSLSLEDELKSLKDKDQKKASNFGLFQTGCRGVVFVLCTVPGSAMVPPIKPQKRAHHTGDSDESTNKKAKLENEVVDGEKVTKNDECIPATSDSVAVSSKAMSCSTKWDPVPIVKQILQDIDDGSGKDAPSSRFVTRMIPIQATCYASEEELQITSRSLMQRYFPAITKTFAVSLKRRLCQAALPKNKIIDTVVEAVLGVSPQCKVDLENPQVTVVVEICKTMVGLSVISDCNQEFKNFNLAEARDKKDQHASDEEED